MGNLLKFDFRKLFHQKSFYILCAISIALICISSITINFLYESSIESYEGVMSVSIPDSLLNYLSGASTLMNALNNTAINFLIPILVVLIVCSDFTYGTLKNILARGYSREQTFGSKFIISTAACILLVLVTWISAYVIGTLLWGAGTLTGENLLRLLYQLICILAYASMAFFFSVLCKKTGSAIACVIFVPILITVILSMLDVTIKNLSFSLADYWLGNCLNTLCSAEPIPSGVQTAVLTSAVYFVLFGAASALFTHKLEA